ncbi:MAG: hypothetical protein ABFD89_09660 [Bryobacteraceae bacterium]
MPDLIELPVAEAKRLKHEIGRLKYGGDQFVGNPLVELFDECLDGMNYCDECIRRGLPLQTIKGQLLTMAERVKALYEASRG